MLYLSSITVSFIVSLVFIFNSAAGTNEVIAPIQEFEIILGDSLNIEFQIRNHSETEPKNATLIFKPSDYITYPLYVDVKNWTAHLLATGVHPVVGAVVEAVNCTVRGSEKCDLDISEAFVRVSVIRSKFLSALVQIVGWSYFFAWSISFYPQILLNFKRKSVIGLNFDFLALNLVGFGAYSLYNLLMYFSEHVKQIYHFENPRSPPPVLTNDVVFAVHAFFACAVTVVQCFIYERENQQVSKKCIVLIIVLLVFGTVSAVASVFNKISILQFVSNLSYIKMAVTCSKYFPQAYMNYLRKSTNGWSIGNVLLDFTGGTLDILQMVFQALNVSDWSAFIANPVKFGLGLISIVFDVLFIIQHYILYGDAEGSDYEGIEDPERSISSEQQSVATEEILDNP